MVTGGRLEQEKRKKEKILATKMLPNNRPYGIEFLSFPENDQQLTH